MIYRALKLTREFHRLKQGELAGKLKISKSYLSEIESGKKPPTVEILEKYAAVFDIPASTLFMFSERLENGPNARREAKAKKILQFLEWVIDEGGEPHAKEA